MLRIYYASPFFDDGGFMKSQKVVDRIREEFGDKVDVYLPQENGSINDKSDLKSLVTPVDIANGDNFYLKNAHVLIADLDGVEIDSGVSAEIGYIAGRNSIVKEERLMNEIDIPKIIAFNTDMRINPVTTDMIDLLQNTDKESAIDIVENLKYNNLYRNLYTVGLSIIWGSYISESRDRYIDEIIDKLRDIMKGMGLDE